MKYLRVVLQPLHPSALVNIFKRLQVVEIARPNLPKTIVYEDDIIKYSEYITDSATFGYIVRQLYNRGQCNRKDWWKIIIITRRIKQTRPHMQVDLHEALFEIFTEDYLFFSY